jgi:hypothetical protein
MESKRHRSHSRKRHRTRAQRLRLKERVRRRFRLRRWRRVLVGLSVLAGIGLVGTGAVWAIMFFINSAAEPAPVVADVAIEEPRLIGVWQSDPDANIGELRRTQTITDQQERELRKNSFKTKVTYTDNMMATDQDGTDRDVEMQSYQIVSKEGDEVVIKTWFNATRQEEEVRIRFVGADSYWLEAKQFGLIECFRRVR